MFSQGPSHEESEQSSQAQNAERGHRGRSWTSTSGLLSLPLSGLFPLCQAPAQPRPCPKSPAHPSEATAQMPCPALLLAGRDLLRRPQRSPRVKQGGHQPLWPAAWSCPGGGAPPAPDTKDLLCVLLAVGGGGDDEQPVQQVDGDAVGALVAGAPDPGEEEEGRAIRVTPLEPGPSFSTLRTPHPTHPLATDHSLGQIPLSLQLRAGVTAP